MFPLDLVKRCTKCGGLLPRTARYFSRRKTSVDRLRTECKACRSDYNRVYRERPESRERKNELQRRQWAANPEPMREQTQRWRRENRARIREQNKQYRLGNADRIKEYNRLYRLENADRCKESIRRCRAANPDGRRAEWHRYQARKKGNGGTYSDLEWNALCASYGNVCLRCGMSVPLTVDHVIPVSMGGENDISNLQPLCLSCNSIKHTKTADYRDCRAIIVDRTEVKHA